MTDQNQKGGDNSTNIQAGGSVTIHQGVTASEARQIALDVFHVNFLIMKGEAADVARTRGEKITESFLQRLEAENPDGLTQAKEPDFQHAMFTVQKEFARCGDDELGALLVDLLVDRTKQPVRSILQIVLNESLAVAPKLTHDQLSALSLIFLFRYSTNKSINSLDSLDQYLGRNVAPFASSIDKKDACYQHLEYTGCGAVSLGAVSLIDVFRRSYPGLFSKGFTESDFKSLHLSIPFDHPILIACLHDNSRRQVNAMNTDTIQTQAAKHGIVGDEVQKLVRLQDSNLMADDDIKKLIVARQPYMQQVFDVWSESNMRFFTLTSVGIAIGHANVKKNVGEFTDLGIWIN